MDNTTDRLPAIKAEGKVIETIYATVATTAILVVAFLILFAVIGAFMFILQTIGK